MTRPHRDLGLVAIGMAAALACGCNGDQPTSGDGGNGDSGQTGAPAIGSLCVVPDASPAVTAIDPMASACESQICLRPALDPNRFDTPDTGGLCSAVCATDADCTNAESRSKNGGARCTSSFACGVATETGLLCCKKLCMCRDFLVIPDAGVTTPAGCDPGNPVNTCKNLPGR